MSATQGANSPNQYHLRGESIAVTFFPEGVGPVDNDRGALRLIYQDRFRSHAFFGNEVRTIDTPDLGSVVSVTIDRTTDFGDTTFSLLLPVVVLPGHPNASARIDTEGITTIHPGVFGIGQPQRDLYAVVALSGTASNGPVPMLPIATTSSGSGFVESRRHNNKAAEGTMNSNMPPKTSPEKPSNQPRNISYRGYTATLHDPGEPAMPMVSVDGTDVMVRREETGGYSAPMLNMFSTYTTLEELTRSLIDTSPVFLAQRKA